MKQLIGLAEQSRAALGDYTGPGKEDRFFDAGPRWPTTASNGDAPTKDSAAQTKANSQP